MLLTSPDYRIKENRREAFVRWYAWSLQFKDCDPSVWCTNYLHSRYEHNEEERIWFAWLYGNTYQLPTAWVLKNEFPDFELATVDRIEEWNTHNYKRLRYQTDTKWNKGHLPSMFASYQKFIGDSSTQRKVIESCFGDNEEQNFENLWETINKNLHKFGRYSTWFYLQHLKHTANIAITPTSLMLNDYNGSRSHRNGLLYALGMEDKVNQHLTVVEYDYLENAGREIIEEMKSRFPNLSSQIDFFTMETCLCSFKKIFRTNHGRYLGYYLDRQSEEIQKAEVDGWYGIEWEVLWQARQETLDKRLSFKYNISKEKFSYFLDSGDIDSLDWMFEDENSRTRGLERFM